MESGQEATTLPSVWMRGTSLSFILTLNGVPSHREAVRMLHYPSLPGEEELGRKRLAMDELLELQLEMQKRRKNLLKNHPMEQCTIIIALLHQFHEVVTVDGSLVIKANYDVAQQCLYLYLHIL